MTRTSLRFTAAVGLALAAGTLSAQFGPPGGGLTAAPMAEGCVFERNWVEAEETTEGIVLVLAREALALCLARANPAHLNRSADGFPARCEPQRALAAGERTMPGLALPLARGAERACHAGEGPDSVQREASR